MSADRNAEELRRAADAVLSSRITADRPDPFNDLLALAAGMDMKEAAERSREVVERLFQALFKGMNDIAESEAEYEKRIEHLDFCCDFRALDAPIVGYLQVRGGRIEGGVGEAPARPEFRFKGNVGDLVQVLGGGDPVIPFTLDILNIEGNITMLSRLASLLIPLGEYLKTAGKGEAGEGEYWPSWRDVPMVEGEISLPLPPVPTSRIPGERRMELATKTICCWIKRTWDKAVEFVGEDREELMAFCRDRAERAGFGIGILNNMSSGMTEAERKDLVEVFKLIRWFTDWPCHIAKYWIKTEPNRMHWREYDCPLADTLPVEFCYHNIMGGMRGIVAAIAGVPIKDVWLWPPEHTLASGGGDFCEFVLQIPEHLYPSLASYPSELLFPGASHKSPAWRLGSDDTAGEEEG